MSTGDSGSSSCSCCKALWVKFYLTGALSSSSASATAKVLSSAASVRQFWQGDDPDPDNAGFNVYNLESQNPASSAYQFNGQTNAVGLACFDDSLDTTLPDADQKGRYRIVEMQDSGSFKRVTFVLPQALSNQSSVSGCPVMMDWFGNAGATSVTVLNEAGWQADAGAEGYADWRPADGQWVIMLLPCPTGSS